MRVGFPFNCPFVGAKLVLPGPHLDAQSLIELYESEKVTVTAGVPTVVIGILNVLDDATTKHKLSLRMIIIGALPSRRLR